MKPATLRVRLGLLFALGPQPGDPDLLLHVGVLGGDDFALRRFQPKDQVLSEVALIGEHI